MIGSKVEVFFGVRVARCPVGPLSGDYCAQTLIVGCHTRSSYKIPWIAQSAGVVVTEAGICVLTVKPAPVCLGAKPGLPLDDLNLIAGQSIKSVNGSVDFVFKPLDFGQPC